MGPSLALALPTFVLGLFVCIAFALMLVFFKGTRLDFAGVVVCVVLLSISGLFYIIAGQWMFAKVLRWVPYSGFVDGRSEEHTSELQSLMRISYAVFCLEKK